MSGNSIEDKVVHIKNISFPQGEGVSVSFSAVIEPGFAGIELFTATLTTWYGIPIIATISVPVTANPVHTPTMEARPVACEGEGIEYHVTISSDYEIEPNNPDDLVFKLKLPNYLELIDSGATYGAVEMDHGTLLVKGISLNYYNSRTFDIYFTLKPTTALKTEIILQGELLSSFQDTLYTDDPLTMEPNDATVVQIHRIYPQLHIIRVGNDADGDGRPTRGDVVQIGIKLNMDCSPKDQFVEGTVKIPNGFADPSISFLYSSAAPFISRDSSRFGKSVISLLYEAVATHLTFFHQVLKAGTTLETWH